MIALLLHMALMLAAAPLLVGLAGWTEARLSGREGPSPLQPWRDLRRLAAKPASLPEGTSWVFAAAPAATLLPLLAGVALVPSFTLGMASAPFADLVLVGGLLAASRAALALGLIDGGTALGGQAGARIIRAGMLAAPPLAAVLLSLTLLAGSTNIDAITSALRESRATLAVPLAIAAATLVALDRSSGCGAGLPADGASAWQVGEWSGRDLALIAVADMLATLLWASLIALLLPPHPAPATPWAAWPALPPNLGPGLAAGTAFDGASLAAALDQVTQGLLGWVIKLAVLGLLLGFARAAVPRPDARTRQALLGLATLLGVLATLLVAVGGGGT